MADISQAHCLRKKTGFAGTVCSGICYYSLMSTLAKIEEAIVRLPAGQVDKLAAWLEHRRSNCSQTLDMPQEPDFSARARKIWGERPAGKPLSELVSDSRSWSCDLPRHGLSG